MANKIGNASSNQQVNDAQHLDNMTSLQQPGEAERALIAQHGEVKGDAPVNNSSPSTPDSPSLFNDPKNPNNKVVEVESEEGDGNEETITSAEESGNQDARSAEELASINNNKLNDVFTVQENGQDGNAQSAAEAAANSNTANQNAGGDAGVGGGSVSPLIRAKVKTGDASASSSEAQSSEGSSSSSSASSASTSSSTSSTSSSSSVTSASIFVTSQAQFVPQAPVTNVNEAPTITSGATASFAENATGTVYTATATDIDAGTTLSYSLSGADASLFNIDSSTGVVTFKAAPNYEAPGDAGGNNVYDINVIASDGTLTASKAVAITVTNTNDNAVSTLTDSNSGTNTVAESATVGTAVGVTALATDADTGATITYSLSNDAGGKFAIDSATGVVTVASALDYESATSHTITVLATSSDGSTNSGTYTIAVTNVNEAPTITSGATASFAENATGTVYTATATDIDAGTTLSYSLSGADASLFNIDSSTGVVTFKAAPNYEAPGDAGGNNVYDINVIASDGTLTASKAVAITVTNTNDNAVSTLTDSNSGTNTVAESATVGTAVGVTALATDADTGATITYSLSNDAGGKFAIDSATGVVTVASALDYESATSHTITVLATSSDGSTNSGTYTIAVTNVNEAPTITSGATASFAENATGTVYTATATDIDAGTTLSYSLSGADASLFNIDSSTGVVTFKAAPNYEAPGDAGGNNVYDINVIASDGTLTASKAVAITVTNTNDNAVSTLTDSNSGTNTVAESATVGTAVGVTALATDADTGATITYSLSNDAGGKFAIDSATGVVTVASALDYESATSHTITVLATSSDGSTNSGTYTIAVTNVNEAPTITSGATASFAENATGTVYTATATDIDAGTTLSYSLSGADASLFNIDSSTGVVTFKAAPNYEAPGDAGGNNVYDINVIASDGTLTASKAVAITVTNTNDNAVSTLTDSNSGTNTVAESATVGTAVGVTALATDADTGATITYSLSNDAGGKFAIDSATGVVTVASALDYESATSHTITVLATSSDGSTNSGTYTIAVTNVNEAPTITSGATASFAENATGTVYTATATDIDAGTTLSYSLSGADASLFNIDSSTGVVTFKAAPNYEAPGDAGGNNVYDINVIASDGTLTASKAVAITVTNTNDNAVSTLTDSNSGTNTVAESATVGTAVGVTALATDADTGATITYSLSNDAGGKFAIDSATGVVTVASALDYESATSHTITVLATSSDGSTNSGTYTIAVTNVNEAPTITSGATASFAENATGTVYTATATDIDAGTTLSYSLSGADASLFNIDSSTGVVTFKAAPNYEAPGDAGGNNVYDINVIASDGTLTASKAVAITVTNTNDNAVSTLTDSNSGTNTVAESATVGTAVGVTALATDADTGATITYSLSNDAGGKFAIDSATGVVTVASALDYESATSHTITVLATSSDGSTNSGTYTIAVTNVNEAPTITSGATASFAENATGTVYTATATDIDAGTTLSYSLSGADASLFNIDSSTGVVTFKAAPNYEAPGDAGGNNVYDINVIASDGTLTASKAVAITVTNTNDNAVSTLTDSNSGTNTVAESATVGTAVGVTALATDADTGATITYSLSNDAGGKFAIDSATGVVTVASALDYESATSHTITVLATSSDGSTNSGTYTIAVTNVNEAPTITSGATASFAENATGTVYTATATDIDAGTTLSYSLSGADASLFNIDSSTGVVTFKAAPNYEAPGDAGGNNVYDINVIASDGTLTASKAVAITVTNTNDNAVSTLTDSNSGTNTVAESATVGTAVGVTALATDADTGATITYSLSNDAGGKFAIDSATGVVTVASALDYESATSHTITVLATSSDGSTNSGTYTIAVTNVNEAPTITSGATASFAENATGTVYTATATDIDAGTTLSYSLSGADASLFNIDSSTGVVTFKAAPNYEAPGDAGGNNVYDINVIASDGTLTASKAVAITVTNTNDNAVSTLTDSNSGTNTVAESATVGTAVGVTALATDADTGATITYSLSNDAGGKFAIDSATGVVTVASALDYESATSHTITVLATSSDGSTNSGTYTIAVTNVNEAPVAIADSIYTNSATTSNLPTWALSANDTDVDSSSLSVTNAANNSGLTGVSLVSNIVSAGSIANGDSLTYTVSDGALTSTATATFTLQSTNITGTAGNEILINATTTARTLSAAAGNDILIGNTGNDTLTGGTGADVMLGGGGRDTFIFAAGASGQETGFDVIKDYYIGAVGTTPTSGDLINFSTSNLSISAMTAAATSTKASVNSTTGIATFAAGSGTTLADALSDIASATGANSGKMALFQVNGTGDYYLYISDGVSGVGVNDVVVRLEGVSAITTINIATKNLTITAGTSVSPISIDLDGDGVEYLNRNANVVYDYSNNNLLQSTAWVSADDGLLAIQRGDGSLNITFSTQSGETDLEGLAKVYDTNFDKVFDAKDTGFNDFGVWQDADSDGVVDAGEFLSLADRGIISLSLTSDGIMNTAADGDVLIYGQTTYTMTDGSLGIAEDVAFAVSDVNQSDGNGAQDVYQIASVANSPLAIDDFNVDEGDFVDLSAILNPTNTVQSTIAIDADGSESSHSTITVNIGGVDYEVATLYGKELGVGDVLGDHAGGASLVDSLNGADWTDVVDISSEFGGPASISEAGGSLTNAYSNEGSDWTVQIKSGTATVDAANKEINFTSDNAENLAIITTADGTLHEISNVDKILWR